MKAILVLFFAIVMVTAFENKGQKNLCHRTIPCNHDFKCIGIRCYPKRLVKRSIYSDDDDEPSCYSDSDCPVDTWCYSGDCYLKYISN